MRIVSLLPSATEVLDWLGVSDQVVGVTFECDVPSSAASLPHVTDTIIAAGATPAEIDATIKDAMAAGRELYTLDRQLLRDLEPELLVSQDLCRVCALPAGTAEQACEELGLAAEVFQYDPMTLDGVLSEIDRLAEVVGVHAATDPLRDRLTAVAETIGSTTRPKVLLLEWTDPPFCWPTRVAGQANRRGKRSALAKPMCCSWHPADSMKLRPPSSSPK